ncbi:glycosyltransferase [Patescibacteria group bacterium]|nr:glycosyltransferase [Patescibacteria group bacterium]
MNIISIIIPCRNEEEHIQFCLQSVLNFRIPEDTQIEILIVDGMSNDQTVTMIKNIMNHEPRVSLLKNLKLTQAVAMNLALSKAKGSWIMRLDAHSIYPRDYLMLCLETAERTGADNVGGVIITKEGDNSYQASIVQAISTHKFGVGNSGFRTGAKEGPADTVPFGFFKTEVFKRVGVFNEKLIRAQDFEFNARIRRAGGKIWLNPNIHCYYYNQKSLFNFYRKQILLDAPYNAYMWYLAPYTFTIRHAITALFSFGFISGTVLSLISPVFNWLFISIMVLYFFLALFSSVQQAIRYKNIKHVFILPFCFFLYHFIHGLGLLKGIVLLIFNKAPVQKGSEPWPGAGKF